MRRSGLNSLTRRLTRQTLKSLKRWQKQCGAPFHWALDVEHWTLNVLP